MPPSAAIRAQLEERDEAGEVTATYVASSTDAASKDVRIDVVYPESRSAPLSRTVMDMFLPVGFPHSVTDDYLQYQIWAFTSAIAGMLSSRAVLEGVGVGDSTATPTAALLLSVFQQSIGRISTILFAHRFGRAIEPDCKTYRLLADVLNDIAFVLDLLSPAFPRASRVFILATSGTLRALCGVCAGSKASLSNHFASVPGGNVGELNAKDSSQETIISLAGLMAGSVIVQYVKSDMATWTLLIVLIAMHLQMNYMAVRAVTMKTINRQRAGIIFNYLWEKKTAPSPRYVSDKEKIFTRAHALRKGDGSVAGWIVYGASFSHFPNSLGFDFLSLCNVFSKEQYVLFPSYGGSNSTICVGLKPSAETKDMLKAYLHAMQLLKLRQASETGKGSLGTWFEDLKASLKQVNAEFGKYMDLLQGAGWDLETNALLTSSGVRFNLVVE